MSNFSFIGSFSGTSPGRPGGRMLDFSKLRLTQPSLAGSGAEFGNNVVASMIIRQQTSNNGQFKTMDNITYLRKVAEILY